MGQRGWVPCAHYDRGEGPHEDVTTASTYNLILRASAGTQEFDNVKTHVVSNNESSKNIVIRPGLVFKYKKSDLSTATLKVFITIQVSESDGSSLLYGFSIIIQIISL